MSYTIPTDAYWNPGPVAYADEPHEPVPGWGMRPNMTGPRLVGVGGLGATGDAAGVDDVPVPLVPLFTNSSLYQWALPSMEKEHRFPTVGELLKLVKSGNGQIFSQAHIAQVVNSKSGQAFSKLQDVPYELEPEKLLQKVVEKARSYSFLSEDAKDKGQTSWACGMAYAESLMWRSANKIRGSTNAYLGYPGLDFAQLENDASIRGDELHNQAVKEEKAKQAKKTAQKLIPKPARANTKNLQEEKPPPKPSTALYVGIGVVALAAVGGAVWYMKRKK